MTEHDAGRGSSTSGNDPPTTADLYRSGHAARIVRFYELDERVRLTCPQCGWEGATSEGSREYHRGLFDVSCPSCDKMLLIVEYPTIEETRAAAAAGNPRAIADLPQIEQIEGFNRRFDAQKLRSPDQLPELGGRGLEFIWDQEGSEPDCQTVIRLGDRVLWSEPSVWEGAWRFEEVKAILKQRYGTRFMSLTPSEQSEMYLYGDLSNRHVSVD